MAWNDGNSMVDAMTDPQRGHLRWGCIAHFHSSTAAVVRVGLVVFDTTAQPQLEPSIISLSSLGLIAVVPK